VGFPTGVRSSFVASSGDVKRNYGADLSTWQQILAELSADDPDVFSTSFTRDLGLEPSGPAGVLLYDPLSAFLFALQGAADA
jgi:hypothetical protein